LLDREQITPREGVEQEFREIISHMLETHRKRLSHHSWLEEARQKLQSRRKPENSADEG